MLSDLYLYGLLILVLAVVIDLLLGEPPNAAHPVVWIGKVIGFMDRHTKRNGRKGSERARGVLLALVPLLLFPFVFTLLLASCCGTCSAPWSGPSPAPILLKTMFAINAMGKHTLPIQRALERGGHGSGPQERFNDRLPRRQQAGPGAYHLVRGRVGGGEHGGQHFLAAVLLRAGRHAADHLLPGLQHAGRDGRLHRSDRIRHVGWFSAKLDDCTNYICARHIVAVHPAGADDPGHGLEGCLEGCQEVPQGDACRRTRAGPCPRSPADWAYGSRRSGW